MHLNHNSRFSSRGAGRFTRGIRHRNQRAFTLIEVLLSLAVVAVSAMAIIGSIDVALAIFDQSMQETVQSQIVQQLTTQAAQTDFSNLNTFVTASPYYYDASGVQVTTASQAIYTAQVSQVAAPSGISFSASNLDLFRAQIYTTRGAAQPNLNDPTEATYTFRIANTGNRL